MDLNPADVYEECGILEIAVRDVHKYFGAEHILKGISFEIYKGEKVGLLGKNGSGKTTLFKILSGMENYEEGNVSVAGKASILAQIPDYPENFKVIDVLKTSFEKLYKIRNEMAVLEKKMAAYNTQTNSCPQNIIKAYGALQIEFETMGGYNIDSDIAKVCNGLGIDKNMQEKPFKLLSGGEKTRVNLAGIILERPEILLLDEPTNHLDINMIEWLEEYLMQYRGTVLVISHDRYFLDRVVQRVIEIVDGKSEFYEGNYSYYVKEKENRYLQKLQQYEQEQKKIKQLVEASRRMHQWASVADNPSLHRRAFAMEKRIERMEKTEKPRLEKGIRIGFKGIKFGGNDVIIIKGLSKSYNSRCIINDINLKVEKGDRIALLGRNGCGKTTLIKIITGEEIPDSGFCRIGPSVRYALLPQIVNFDNPDLSILDIVRNELVLSEEAARNRLGAYHFRGEDVFKKVNVLSGGEKSRLKLCILMNSDINLLILDEPTNHLDIASKEWIEEAIANFDGTLLFVSHDRYLVNRFATRIWDMEEGSIFDFKGTYEQYKKWKEINKLTLVQQKENEFLGNKKRNKDNDDYKSSHTTGSDCKTEDEGNTENTKNKDISKDKENKGWRSKKERQIASRLREIEREITEIEESIKTIEDKMVQNASDYESLQDFIKEKEELDLKLGALFEEWEQLEG